MTTMTKRITRKQVQAERVRNTITTLQEMLQPGDTVYTILKKCSRSGMYRHIAVIVKERNISGLVATADERKWHDDDSVGASGCGMDMGFEVVYSLSSTLFPNGFLCIGDGCPSNDHHNGDRNYATHHHTSGGYALKQRWL